MNKKSKIVVIVSVALVVVLVGAGLLYRGLAGGMDLLPEAEQEERPQAPVVVPQTDVSVPETQADESREEAQDFAVYDAEGNAVSLSDFVGKPIVLNFWASWCPPCKSEMPHFEELSREMGEDVVFMMVDMVDGGRETQETGAAYIEEMGYTFPVYYDTYQEAAYTYGVRSIPTTYFIDAQGDIAWHVVGAMDEETLRAGIELIQE